MTIQIINISIPTVFTRYSKKYNIYRDLYGIDNLGLEIRDIDENLASELKNNLLSENIICYSCTNKEKERVDFMVIGTYSVIKDSIKENIFVIDETLGHKLNNVINNFSNHKKGTFNLSGKTIFLNKSYVMGILNVTPDSFSDGGRYFTYEKAINHGIKMLDDGADIIDIGGESTRPGSDSVEHEEQIKRVVPVIHGILNERPNTIISIDTTNSVVAEEAISAGAKIINDISGGTFDEKIFKLSANTNTALILMHIKGKPKNMQEKPLYVDVVNEIYDFLEQQVLIAKSYGIEEIIIDPGIGFGKTVANNYEIISRIDEFKCLGKPILIGISKKSFIGKSLNLNVDEREAATVALESIAVSKGAKFIRTHNVKYGRQVADIAKFLTNNESVIHA